MGEDTPECVATPVLFGNRISERVCRGCFAGMATGLARVVMGDQHSAG